MLRPLDIVVLLKLALKDGRPPYLQLANELHLYPSEVYNSIKRARASHLIQRLELEDRLNRSALLEFLLHGVRYAFPVEKGTLTRGVPTGYAAPPLLESIAANSEPPPVWPYADGPVRGYSFAPLHKNVPQAALEDSKFYELLALVDALRDGRARERELAGRELKKRLEESTYDLSES
jgi:DNA-binding Lrp family transcriptional regulator